MGVKSEENSKEKLLKHSDAYDQRERKCELTAIEKLKGNVKVTFADEEKSSEKKEGENEDEEEEEEVLTKEEAEYRFFKENYGQMNLKYYMR